MRTFSGLMMGLMVLASPVMAQDYSNGPAAKSGQWDYSTGSQSASPGDSYEGYPPPPTQVIISPGMGGGYGGYGGYAGGVGTTSRNGQTSQSGGRRNGVSPGGVGWGNTGMGNVGAGNIGAGNVGAGNVGYGNAGGRSR